MQNVLSIDLESWVHFFTDATGVNNGGTSLRRKRSDNGYLISVIDYILDILKRHDINATFFVLGEIFEWYPDLIFRIRNAGHEIGYHTHDHQRLINRAVLQDQLNKSKEFIDTFKPKGFRAPQIYLTRDSVALLKDSGFEYSSSTYGEYSRRAIIDGLDEIPVSSYRYRGCSTTPLSLPRHLNFKILLHEIPFGSGLFFSLLQGKISYMFKKIEAKGDPIIMFVHPWQILQTAEIRHMSFKLKLAYKNFLAYPYTMSIKDSFETIVSKHKFSSFEELRNGY